MLNYYDIYLDIDKVISQDSLELTYSIYENHSTKQNLKYLYMPSCKIVKHEPSLPFYPARRNQDLPDFLEYTVCTNGSLCTGQLSRFDFLLFIFVCLRSFIKCVLAKILKTLHIGRLTLLPSTIPQDCF